MMHHTGHMLEEPVMRTISQQVYVVRNIDPLGSDVSPTFGDQSPVSGCFDGIKDYLCQFSSVINDDRAKSYVNRSGAFVEEYIQVFGWLIFAPGGEEAESTHIDVLWPIVWF